MVENPDLPMTFGKFKGQPVSDMGTTYLMWMVSQDHIRYKRPEIMRCALEVLRNRFDDFDTLTEELAQDAPPPEYWKEKSLLHASRARLDGETRCEPKAPDQVMDGYYFAREGNLNTDVSDLV